MADVGEKGDQEYSAFWLDAGDSYPLLMLTKVTLEKLAVQKTNAREQALSSYPALVFSTYKKDSIWATSLNGFLFPAVIRKLDTKHSSFQVVYSDRTKDVHKKVKYTAATRAEIHDLVKSPEGKILISRLNSPTSCVGDMDFLRSVVQRIAK